MVAKQAMSKSFFYKCLFLGGKDHRKMVLINRVDRMDLFLYEETRLVGTKNSHSKLPVINW